MAGTKAIGSGRYLGPNQEPALLPSSEAENPVVDFEGGQEGDEFPKVYEIHRGRVIVLGESEVTTYTPTRREPKSEGVWLRCLVIREYGGKRIVRIKADQLEDFLFELQ